ncbi:hypothetical protein ACIQPR_02530 [Streptomyces sp. NPDC091280]|uniref:DUF3885 domain-containing protein n=1 Tax=Streptomyces sp. NPDC091280 TaxID=3365984 RepID=UPI003817FFDD
MAWSWEPDGPELPPERYQLHPEGPRRTTLAYDDDPDLELHSYKRLYADCRLSRIHHPYDGGADVIATSSAERDRVRDCDED